MFPPKKLIFFTKSFTHLFYPQFTFLWYDTPAACMAKISSEPPCMAGHSIYIIHINERKEKVRLEGKYSFVSFLCLFPYAHAHGFFSFLMHTHKVCVWKENILFSFISYAQAHDLAFFFGTIHFLLPPFSMPPASIVRATRTQASPPTPQATGAPVHRRVTANHPN